MKLQRRESVQLQKIPEIWYIRREQLRIVTTINRKSENNEIYCFVEGIIQTLKVI